MARPVRPTDPMTLGRALARIKELEDKYRELADAVNCCYADVLRLPCCAPDFCHCTRGGR